MPLRLSTSLAVFAMNLRHSTVGGAQKLSALCLTVAMAAVGLQTRVSAFVRSDFGRCCWQCSPQPSSAQ
jgi:uncharacterized membrane protein YadS